MVRLEGHGLHSGARVAVGLSAERGPTRIVQRGVVAPLAELTVARADLGVRLCSRDGAIAVDLVEHLLAAAGGLGIRGGLRVEVDEELPLLDGGSARFVEALKALGLSPSPPTLRVTRVAELAHEASRYRFRPSDEASLSVAIAFETPIGEQEAAWSGDPEDFERRIAPARTFGFQRDHAALRARGRARHVDLDSVIVFGPDGPLRPMASPDEPARHKLLDLIGDLALYGGPPRGHIHAYRPGHAATHAVVARALASGVLA